MIARLEGGPYDGYESTRPFPFTDIPGRIAVHNCHGCGDPTWHLHAARNLAPGDVVYTLAELDEFRGEVCLRYQYADLTLDPVTVEFEVTAA